MKAKHVIHFAIIAFQCMGIPRSVIANVLDTDIVVSDCELK